MRLKLLLLLLLISGAIVAQEAYRNLIISEIRANDPRFNYVELTNMGTQTVNLAEFELGNNDPWTNAWLAPTNRRFRLPNKLLAPGKSFLVISVDDVPLRIWPFDPQRYLGARTCTPELRSKADLEWHFPTSEWGSWAAYDSISPSGELTFDNWGGRSAVFLRHYFKETPTERDSAIVDAFNANFNASASPYKPTGSADAAGVTGATGNRILVRKFTVTEGTGDAIDSWTRVAGVDITDSEWLPLRYSPNDWNIAMKKEYWTPGNHGNYTLSATSVKGKTSATVVDFTAKTITVPWGVRRNDQFSNNFVYSPGIAWYYSLSGTPADSAYASARTNDTISFYAAGNTLQEIKFKIIALPSTTADNLVVPRVPMNLNDTRYRGTYMNMGDYCGVTTGLAVDTILAGNYVLGIGFATRTDSLMKYLEKPTQASWQFVFVDGVTRADLKTGDKLKVTAGNGSVKEYYIKIDKYVPSKIARLSAITWPDIPVDLKGIFGWTGDTIPLFSGTMFDYVVEIPASTSGMPALVPKAEMLNTTIDVVRATNLAGSLADKTVTFNTTAEDGTTTQSYRVTMNKQKDPDNLQPNPADPFISDLIYRDQWASTMIQVVNPGNQVLDMSNYMFVWRGGGTPADAIASLALPADWANRYQKYIPGYKWVNQATWETKPGMVIQDLAVSSIVEPGKVFAIADVRGTGQSSSVPTFPWGGNRCNVDLATGRNPWGETVPACLTGWHATNYFLFRINNDSIKNGLKPATDPNDFTLLDVFGSGDGTNNVIAGRNIDQIMSFSRKPEIYKGNTAFKGSFGTDAATSEWTITDRPYWVGKGYGWPRDILMVASFIGSHFMNEVTAYKSTVNSVAYKVSEGYSMKETIKGVKANTSVEDFLARIIKANPDQKLTLTSATTGKELKGAETLANEDMLEVLSADGMNKSKYILSVTANGLSTNAVLTPVPAGKYFISTDVNTGGIYLVPKNTKVTAAIANVIIPAGATLTVINDKGAWVPFKTLNFDTTYVDVMITDKIFFEVVAEDGVTKIKYQIFPDTKPAEAFILSDIYSVDQTKALIQFVPRGTTVQTLLSNLFPVTGATVKVVDKAGIQRTSGGLYQDDMVVVTSKDGKVTKVYYLDMLQTQFVSTAYLAYVLSDVFTVDQMGKVIAKPVADSPAATFLAKLTPAFGATMKIYNKNGVPSTTTTLKRGDVLRVTSLDGLMFNNYAIEMDYTLIDQNGNGIISVYPNPTSDEVNLSGMKAGNRIRIYNLMGAAIVDRIAQRSIETINLDSQPAGLYLITVSNTDQVIGKYKLVKQ